MANVYGMTGGVGGDPYTGSYNITPTTSDITLNTTDKILERDLTIQGGENLYGSAIKYGSSIFGVNGTGVPLTFRGGQGMAFKNGVAYEGDIIRNVEDKQELKQIGTMNSVENKYANIYNNLPYNVDRILLSQKGTRIITQESIYGNTSSFPKYGIYDNGSLLIDIDLVNLVSSHGSILQLNIEHIVDVKTGNLIVSVTVYDTVSNNTDHCYRYLFNINIDTATYSSVLLTTEGSFQQSSLTLSDEYLGFVYSVYRGTSGYDSNAYLYVVNKNTFSTFAMINITNITIIPNYGMCQIGDDGSVYYYCGAIVSVTDIYPTFYRFTTSGSQVYSKTIRQEDLNFSGTTKPGQNTYATMPAFFVDYLSNAYIYYSNVETVSWEHYEDGLIYLATYSTNMSSKISDLPLNPRPTHGMVSYGAGSYYDNSTNTLLLYSESTLLRVGLNGNVYASLYGNNYIGHTVPYLLENKEVDYCYYVYNDNKAYEDTSAMKVKIITTDTYTATIEEV